MRDPRADARAPHSSLGEIQGSVKRERACTAAPCGYLTRLGLRVRVLVADRDRVRLAVRERLALALWLAAGRLLAEPLPLAAAAGA